MSSQFKSLGQLFDFFKDEETCVAWYEKKRWGETVVCPFCDSEKVYRTIRGFKCANNKCHKKFTVKVGTIFENSKIPLRTWFAAMFLISTSKKGVSSVQLSEQLNITQKSSWFLLHRIREMLNRNTSANLNGMVQGDESYFGGKNKNRHADKKVENSQGRSAKDKVPVVGLIEQGKGTVRTFVVDEVNKETLHTIIHNNVDLGSTVVTDNYKGYSGLGEHFKHVVVKHKDGGYIVEIEGNRFHTNNIENFWSVFKRGYIGIYHLMSKKHLHRYCNEFAYRYNIRQLKGAERFFDVIEHADSARIRYSELIEKQ